MVPEWDFRLTSEIEAEGCAPATDSPVAGLDRMRPMVTADGTLMVFCIGCGDPMPLEQALAHTCDLPPAGRL
jgi:hypothetical protein